MNYIVHKRHNKFTRLFVLFQNETTQLY